MIIKAVELATRTPPLVRIVESCRGGAPEWLRKAPASGRTPNAGARKRGHRIEELGSGIRRSFEFMVFDFLLLE